MKNPAWLAVAIAEQGALALDGKLTRTEAHSAVSAIASAHPEFLAEIASVHVGRLLGKWIADHESCGDLFQAQMFPGLPSSMRTAPKKSVALADMTAEDLDHAKNMLWARTANMIKGSKKSARRERRAFSRLYDHVRPLLTGDLKVSDVLGQLGGEENAA